jgi:hypothetical protein
VTNGDKLNLLIALCSFILVFLLWPEKKRTPKKTAAKDKRHYPWQYEPTYFIFFRKYKHWYPDEYRHEAEERKYWRRQNGIAVITLISAIAAGVIAFDAFRETQKQARAALEANKISRALFISQQRAYMYYDGPNFGKDEISPGVYRFSISPKIGNSGNTPTKELTTKVNCWLDPKVELEPFDDFRTQSVERQNGFYGPRAILQAIECHYTMAQAKAVMDGQLHSYIAADIRYKDSVDPKMPEHLTQFVLEFMISHLDAGGGLIGGVAQRGKHNCADDGCPKE